MSTGTNEQRITQNNTIITNNNTAIDNFKTAIENLPSGSVVLPDGIRFQNSQCTSLDNIIQNADFSEMTTFSELFNGCSQLQSISFNNKKAPLVTNLYLTFQNCSNLITIDLSGFEVGKVTNINSICSQCSALINIDVSNIDISLMGMSENSRRYAFSNCPNLSNDSLNSILKMCSTLTGMGVNKNLKSLGLSSTQATTCQSLSNWDAFVAAGWSSGY